MNSGRRMGPLLVAGIVVACAMVASRIAAAGPALPGVSDTEIRIGQTLPYSGPGSAFSTQGRVTAAYLQMINEGGGINGKKINFLSKDDGYSPPKTVEQTRRLVESDDVLAIVGSVGTATSLSVRKYLNSKKVPQLLVLSGASKWNDPQQYPWSTPLYVPYRSEAKAYARYILQHKPDAKIAVLFQNDDGGKDYLAGLKAGLGDKAASMIVSEISYEVSSPTVDSQVVLLKTSGADVLINLATPKFAAQAIRKVAELGWKPVHFIAAFSTSIRSVFVPAGLENSTGIITGVAVKAALDPAWSVDRDVQEYLAFLKARVPDADPGDSVTATGYNVAILLVHMLKACGDDLSRENLLRVATSLRDVELPMLLPGVRLTTSSTNYQPYRKLQLQKFNGTGWTPLGEPVELEDARDD